MNYYNDMLGISSRLRQELEAANAIRKQFSMAETIRRDFETAESLRQQAMSLGSLTQKFFEDTNFIRQQQAISLGMARDWEPAKKQFENFNTISEQYSGMVNQVSSYFKLWELDTSGVAEQQAKALASGNSTIYTEMKRLASTFMGIDPQWQERIKATVTPTITKHLASFLAEEGSLKAAVQYYHTTHGASWHTNLIDEALYNKFVDDIALLNENAGKQKFIDIFKRLSPYACKFILFLLLLSWDEIKSISANILTPYAESTIKAFTKQKTKQMKHISLKDYGIDVTNLRFITKQDLRIYSDSRKDSIIIDELPFGKLITVLKKNKNWSRICYKNEDGDLVEGWVFTRYTERFKE